MRKIKVRLGSRSYSVLIGRNLFPSLGRFLKPLKLSSKILIVSNKRVAQFFLKSVSRSLGRAGYQVTHFLLPYGDERDKSQKVLCQVWDEMAKAGLERRSTVLALGGGVVGDIAGFAASTYMRGISLIQVPTTLLAQVDAAIGGKTAIDLPSAKNIVGTFYQPRLVAIDVGTLTGIPVRELRNAFAEIIKYGVIQDPKLFRLLEKNVDWFFKSTAQKKWGKREFSFLEEVISCSARVKVKIVEEDERETKGKRMILNYGHTFAHAFEAASNYRLPHGEAVALGMVAAARLAVRRGLFRREDEFRQNHLIRKAGLPTGIQRSMFDLKRVIPSMLLDKKKKEGRPRFVLPVSLGRAKVVDGVSGVEVKKILSDLGGK